MQVVASPHKVVPFPLGRNIPLEIAEKMAEVAVAHQGLESHVILTKEQLAELILAAVGCYREAVGR